MFIFQNDVLCSFKDIFIVADVFKQRSQYRLLSLEKLVPNNDIYKYNQKENCHGLRYYATSNKIYKLFLFSWAQIYWTQIWFEEGREILNKMRQIPNNRCSLALYVKTIKIMSKTSLHALSDPWSAPNEIARWVEYRRSWSLYFPTRSKISNWFVKCHKWIWLETRENDIFPHCEYLLSEFCEYNVDWKIIYYSSSTWLLPLNICRFTYCLITYSRDPIATEHANVEQGY